MSFKYPLLLLLLLLAPALAWWRFRRRRQAALAFGDGAALPQLPPSWAVRASAALPVLYGLGLVCLMLALARPQKGLHENRVETEGVDIVLLVDVSTSMRAEDFSTAAVRMNRLDAAKETIRDFIKKRPDDRLALVAFSAMPYTLAPLTMDHAWLLLQMDRLQTGMLEDGTAIGDAIASAINRLRESKAKTKLVILLTDGIHNAGQLQPLDAAQLAKAMEVKVYTVGAGSDKPFNVPSLFGMRQVIPEIDEVTLRKVASITGGMYFRATDLASLEKVYDQIDKLEKTKIEMEQYTRYEERFMLFAWWALGLLGLEKVLSLTRLGRLP